jgi:hypothetical protein
MQYFSALTNLSELGIDQLHVSRFMPNVQRYFGHLSPTLRFLALDRPRGSRREILYFVGLFPNPQDLNLSCPVLEDEYEDEIDSALIPLSVPTLRGRLTLAFIRSVKLVEDMIALFGGLRFNRTDLFKVKCLRLLLDGRAETLETLRLCLNDPYGGELLQGIDEADRAFRSG